MMLAGYIALCLCVFAIIGGMLFVNWALGQYIISVHNLTLAIDKRVQKLERNAGMTSPQAIAEFVALFDEYRDYFGLTNAEFPEMEPEDKQCDYEIKVCELICKYKGHDIGPDQCGKPEHDYCYRCQRMKTDIQSEAMA